MRRLALLLAVCLLTVAGIVVGCGYEGTGAPTAERVIGTLPKAQTIPTGSATKGQALFKSKGCDGCHTYKPAGSTAKVGPDLDTVAADAKKANLGSTETYVFDSIKNPSSYLVPGYSNLMPNYGAQLSEKQIADVTAFIIKGGKS